MAVPWLAIATVASSALSGLFGGRSARKEAKANREADQYQFAAERYFYDRKRQDELEGRRYKEDAVAMYRPYTKRPDAPLPVMTDPNTIKPVLPQYGSKFP